MTRSQPLPFIIAGVLLFLGGRVARPDEFKVNDRTFSLPRGFTIERVAGPPLVDRPIVADFDEQGRLYVADSSGSNDKVEKQLAERPHRIVRLEDEDGDGIYDRQTVFADKMMFPAGTMWYDGSLYVSAPPSIWKLTDTNDDGVADERVEWFKGKTLTGCANDLHGPYLGPDGWIYWCKGAFATQTYERPGQSPFLTRAAHIFRCRPDGTGIEAVMTGGMDNPVDVVFTPSGERIFTTTFLQRPGEGNRDGLLHDVYGGIYGQVSDVVNGHARSGPDLMPVLVHLGAAAPSGLTSFESKGFGDDSFGSLFACNFNLRRVTCHRLQPIGATFNATTEEFLTSPDRDFHPTDVVEDADGSLLVIDTGGWYKLCCPTSQIPKPDVLGAIYRIRYADKERVTHARGRKQDWAGQGVNRLVTLLADERPAVQKRAIDSLAKHGIDACAQLENVMRFHASSLPKRNAIWAATRIDEPEARLVAHAGLSDGDPTVRQVALHSISLWRDKTAVRLLLNILNGDKELIRGHELDPHLHDQIAQNRRAAAEALGRIGDKSAVSSLLATAGQAVKDQVLEHSCVYALIEIAAPTETALGLQSANVAEQRAALIALDQMKKGTLEPAHLIPHLSSSDQPTREAASWIALRHPEWAEALTGFFREQLHSEKLSAEEQAQLVRHLARFAAKPPVPTLLAEAVLDPKSTSTTKKLALDAMSKSGLKAVPDSWRDAIAFVLDRGDGGLVVEAIVSARSLPINKIGADAIKSGLLRWGVDSKSPDTLRLDALGAVPGGLTSVSSNLFAFLRDSLDMGQPVAVRMASASVLAKASLDRDQLLALTDAVRAAGPLEVDRLLSAYENAGDETVGLALVAALRSSKATASLRPEMIEPRIKKFGDRVHAEASAFYASLNVDAPAQKARLESLLPKLATGDIIRGQTVFNGPKAGCLSCHAVGYLGGKVGPDLTRIGQIRTERDLLESIIYPSLSFVRSFESITVATRDGKVVNGVVKGDASDEIVLTINANETVRIPRSEIEEMKPGTVSVMPAGLDQQLSQQELADLLAFLKSRK